MVPKGAAAMTDDPVADALTAAPDHLFTWLDVEGHLALLAERSQWPEWLTEINAYWDALRLVVSEAKPTASVWTWLTESFGPLTVDQARQVILLDQSDAERTLPVEIEVDGTARIHERAPR